jgi:hypothetical protein
MRLIYIAPCHGIIGERLANDVVGIILFVTKLTAPFTFGTQVEVELFVQLKRVRDMRTQRGSDYITRKAMRCQRQQKLSFNTCITYHVSCVFKSK